LGELETAHELENEIAHELENEPPLARTTLFLGPARTRLAALIKDLRTPSARVTIGPK